MLRTFSFIHLFALGGALFFSGALWAQDSPAVLTLTQTGCQFLEPEGKDHQFQTGSAQDCERINHQTGEKRLAQVKPLRLKPGKYKILVTNKNVPYALGFWLRGTGFRRYILPSVSGGGIQLGSTKEYLIELKKGSYVYSCPLNPTPNYPLIVQ